MPCSTSRGPHDSNRDRTWGRCRINGATSHQADLSWQSEDWSESSLRARMGKCTCDVQMLGLLRPKIQS